MKILSTVVSLHVPPIINTSFVIQTDNMSFSETLLDATIAGISILPVKQFVEDVAEKVNYQFIDEIFHYPQFQTIFHGDYQTWDPKITTPPGLYYLTSAYCKLFNVEESLENARHLNLIGGVLMVCLCILMKLKSPKFNSGFSSAGIFLNPLLSLFYSLYYTDVWSSVFIVAAYTMVILRPFNNLFITSVSSSILGFISLTFRQTNIIWCLFLAFIMMDSICKEEFSYDYEGTLNDLSKFVKTSLKNFVILVPWLFVGISFITFVYLNGGIALGDKENHILVPHLAQLCYCMTFIAIFTIPQWISMDILLDYLKFNLLSIQGLVFNICWIPMLYNFIANFTIIHPFLLADNRHYSFYIIKNFITRTELSKYQLLPVYHFSFYVVVKTFRESCDIVKNQNNIKKDKNLITPASPVLLYAFILCTALSVILSPLFEPRYYILPYIFFRLLTKPSEYPILEIDMLELFNKKIRYFTEILWLWFWTQGLYVVFLDFTFSWDNLVNPQRVIW